MTPEKADVVTVSDTLTNCVGITCQEGRHVNGCPRQSACGEATAPHDRSATCTSPKEAPVIATLLCRTIGCTSIFARWWRWPHRLICNPLTLRGHDDDFVEDTCPKCGEGRLSHTLDRWGQHNPYRTVVLNPKED